MLRRSFLSLQNYLDHLRKQYARRSPETNKLGTLDEPVSWEELGLGDKLQVLWDLCEWHMTDPERFRGLVNEGGAMDVEVGWVSLAQSSLDEESVRLNPC